MLVQRGGPLPAGVADMSAARRLAEIRAALNNLLPGTTPQERDDRFATGDALEFANTLRRRRNDASHTTPTYGFDDRAETEELLVSALRHLPNLWRLH